MKRTIFATLALVFCAITLVALNQYNANDGTMVASALVTSATPPPSGRLHFTVFDQPSPTPTPSANANVAKVGNTNINADTSTRKRFEKFGNTNSRPAKVKPSPTPAKAKTELKTLSVEECEDIVAERVAQATKKPNVKKGEDRTQAKSKPTPGRKTFVPVGKTSSKASKTKTNKPSKTNPAKPAKPSTAKVTKPAPKPATKPASKPANSSSASKQSKPKTNQPKADTKPPRKETPNLDDTRPTVTFTANGLNNITVSEGESVNLEWSTQGANRVFQSDGKTIEPNGQMLYKVTKSVTLQRTAKNSAGSETAEVIITVKPANTQGDTTGKTQNDPPPPVETWGQFIERKWAEFRNIPNFAQSPTTLSQLFRYIVANPFTYVLIAALLLFFFLLSRLRRRGTAMPHVVDQH